MTEAMGITIFYLLLQMYAQTVIIPIFVVLRKTIWGWGKRMWT